jgi:hypothetical protein
MTVKKIYTVTLCEHLYRYQLPDTENGAPAQVRCGICHKEFVWNADEKAYVCVIDPNRVEKDRVIGKLFK